MTTTYDTDPNTATVAAAWASSPLGQPEREVRYGFATPDPVESDEPRPVTRRGILAAALASGVIGGAVLGVVVFDFSDWSQPTVVEQGPVPGYAVVVGPSSTAPAPVQVAPTQAPTVMPAPQPGFGPAAVATPPAPSDSPVVVDVPKPEDPPPPPKQEDPPPPPKQEDPAPKPEEPAPEPPNPVPPVPDALDFKLPEPQPDPEPVPPVFQPDLPLAPAPNPDPKPLPPSLPDFGLQAPVKS